MREASTLTTSKKKTIPPETDTSENLWTHQLCRPWREHVMQPNLLKTLFFPRKDLKIAIWNVRSLYASGKVAQTAREMDRYKLEILGLSEVRWTSAGKITLVTGHTLLYSGPSDNDRHENGVRLLGRKANKCLMEWKPVNDRAIRVRFCSKLHRLTIIQCYAPTNQADQATKDIFYQQVQNVHDQVPRREISSL